MSDQELAPATARVRAAIAEVVDHGPDPSTRRADVDRLLVEHLGAAAPLEPVHPPHRVRRLAVAAAMVVAVGSLTVWWANGDGGGTVSTADAPTGTTFWDQVGSDAWTDVPPLPGSMQDGT